MLQSEVYAQMTVDYTVDNAGITDLKFMVSDTDTTPDADTVWNAGIEDVTDAIALAHTNGTKTIYIYWYWDFANDHTAIGEAADTTVPTVTATVTVEQVD